MKKEITFLPVGLVLLLLGGCGTPLVVSKGDPEPGKEDKRVVVAADLSNHPRAKDFSGPAMSWAEARRKFTISRRDQVFAFDDGPAYFKIVSLPGEAAGQKLELLSYYSLDFPTTLFVPAFLFLDSSRQVVTKDTAPSYKVVNGLGEHIRVAVGIPPGAAYVVIFTTPSRVSEQMNFQTYRMTGVVPSPTFDAKDTGFGGFYEGILKLRLARE